MRCLLTIEARKSLCFCIFSPKSQAAVLWGPERNKTEIITVPQHYLNHTCWILKSPKITELQRACISIPWCQEIQCKWVKPTWSGEPLSRKHSSFLTRPCFFHINIYCLFLSWYKLLVLLHGCSLSFSFKYPNLKGYLGENCKFGIMRYAKWITSLSKWVSGKKCLATKPLKNKIK